MVYKDNNTFDSYTTDGIDYNDSRWDALGLDELEIGTIYNVCFKFVNRRDLLEDLIQQALISLWDAFERHKKRGVEIHKRIGFIRRVVMSSMIQHFIRANRRDLIYHTVDVGDESEYVFDQDAWGNLSGTPHAPSNDEIEELDSVIDLYLTDEEQFIAYSYYYLGMTQCEIGKELKRSQSGISTKLLSIVTKIKNHMSKPGED